MHQDSGKCSEADWHSIMESPLLQCGASVTLRCCNDRGCDRQAVMTKQTCKDVWVTTNERAHSVNDVLRNWTSSASTGCTSTSACPSCSMKRVSVLPLTPALPHPKCNHWASLNMGRPRWKRR